MPLNRESGIPPERRAEAVKEYLREGTPLRKIARHLDVSHATLWHWIKRYQEHGTRGLQPGSAVRRNRRIGKDIEMRIMRLKERWPGISIRKAQTMILDQAECSVSTFVIWRVWRDHGFIRKKNEDPLDLFIRSTPALDQKLDAARQRVEKKDNRSAAMILNDLPRVPRTEILKQIPERFLSPRRKLDLLCLERRSGPYEDFAKKARRTGKILERHGLLYSSIIADFLELDALDIIGRPEQKAKVLDRMAAKMQGVKNYSLRFLFAFEQAYTAVYMLQISRAMRFLETCRRLAYCLPYPHYQELFGALLVLVGKFRNAGHFYRMALKKSARPDRAAGLILQIARYAHCYAGEYAACRSMMAAVRKAWDLKAPLSLGSAFDLTKAYLSYGQGHLAEAADSFVRSLETAHQGKHVNRIYAASVGLAGVAMALNNKTEAMTYLRKYLPLMRKNRLRREELLLKCFLNRDTDIAAELKQTPPFCLLAMIKRADRSGKTGDYRKSFMFASRHGLEGLFHRWIVFYPASVVHLMDRGKKTGLPRTIMNFPVFNQNIPVYNVKLLGRMALARNQIRLKVRLSPREKAFLIHLALRASTPGRSVMVSDLRGNFWPKSPDAAALLSHMLVRLRKKLHLASHLLAVTTGTRGSGESRLVNKGIYFTTDYQEFRALLTQAKTLRLSGEWPYARREYIRAFALLRGEPFQGMYDPWSETVRGMILNMADDSARDFARESEMRNGKKEGDQILKKVASIFPGSIADPEELKKPDGMQVGEERAGMMRSRKEADAR
jgi:transposase-like protein/tetratricopeptide (TPR) repeat protein